MDFHLIKAYFSLQSPVSKSQIIPMSTTPVTLESINPQDAKLEALKNLFPEAFREWKLDTTLLSTTLGESISNERESYGMSWAGKSDARKQIVTPTTKSFSPDETASVDFANTDNILIEWDNLEVLKLLQKSYTKQVKMIYIDPPYNTGKDFVYHDNFHTSTAEYEEASGQRDSEWAKLVQNTETNGRYHSDWLSMMYPRLHLARNLLRDDGVIFVSIDDHEVHNLRKIMDEIYGEENFVDSIIWKKRYQWAKERFHAAIHEYILVYARNKENLLDFNIATTDEFINKYFNIKDEKFEIRWWYRTQPLEAGWSMDARPNLVYPVPAPDGTMVMPKKQWVWWKERVFEALEKNELDFIQDKNGKYSIRFKQYLKDDEGIIRRTKPFSIIDNVFTQDWTKEINELLWDNIFNFPKPSRLVKHILDIVTGEFGNDSLILDFFAWSGTTGHAVMALNTEEKAEAIKNGVDPTTVGNRRYMCVQLDEMTDKKSEAYKAGYTHISEITAERLRRAGKKIKEENPNVSFDSGFRLYRLTPSCYQVASVEYDSENSQTTLESLERAIQSGISPLRDWASEADVIVENLIKEWFLLNSRLENIHIGDNHFLHAEREWKKLYMSFEPDISMSTIQWLSREYSEVIFVVYDRALDDSRKVMMSDRVKLRTI